MTKGRMEQEELSRRFAWFGAKLYAHHSPLYSRLAAGVAEDKELLVLASHAASGPEPNLLFAAVHSLLLGGAVHSLADYYPSVREKVREDGDPYPLFRSFCLEYAGEIREILSTRRVQTNEVRRSALLLPAFGLAFKRGGGKPLALIEVGASAGLNLLFDRYAYDYGEGRRLGNSGSSVVVSCALRGDRTPPFPTSLPAVVSRVGVDLNPTDVREPGSILWLLALIWPEEYAQRAPLLRRAIEAARSDPPPLVSGNALDVLPQLLRDVPKDATVCVIDTFVTHQFSKSDRERFAALISEHAPGDGFRISIEWLRGDAPLLTFTSFESGDENETVLARCDDHGGWIQWLASPSTPA